MKKLLVLLLCTAMLLPMAVMAEGDGRTHITYSFWGNQTEAESVQVALDAFNGMQDSIFVEPMQIPNEEYTQTLVNYAIANQLPDCGMVNENAVLYFARNGVMADVSGMYEGEELQPMDCITFRDAGTPVGYSSCNEVLVLYYNKAMFDAANEPYPSADKPYTWDEFVEVAKRLTFDENGKHPGEEGFAADKIVQYGAFVNNWTWQMEVWALSNGGAWFSEDGNEVLINSPEAIESIQKVADLALVEHVSPLNVIPEDNGVGIGIGSGTVAMTTDGTWRLGTDFPNLDINYGIAPLPMMKEEVTLCTSGLTGVFNGKNQEAAYEFVKWYTREESNWASLILTGIWMPKSEYYYKTEEGVAAWLGNEAYPFKDFETGKKVLVDYTMNCAKPACWYYTPNTQITTNEILFTALQSVWSGERTAQDVIQEIYPELCEAIVIE